MPLRLDMEKSAGTLKLSLEKGGVAAPSAELAFDLDVSGSFEKAHRSGQTNMLLSRLVPWGMVFDPDQKLDVFTFSNGPEHVHYVGEMTEANHVGLVRRDIINIVPGWNGGTDYSYVIERNLQHFGWTGTPTVSEEQLAPKRGFWDRLFGRKPQTIGLLEDISVSRGKKSIVIFVTDGEADTNDKQRTHEVLAASEKRGDQVYFLLIGIGRSQFPFLQELADKYGNTGLTIIRDLPKFVDMSDEDLNDELIGDELLEWLKK